FDGVSLARNGFIYVPAEGFASVVTVSARATARVGEWVLLNATRRSGPWNPVRQHEVLPGELRLFEPPIFEREVACNLSWIVDPPGIAEFDAGDRGDPDTRSVMFSKPGTYTLKGHSAFPLKVLSNVITIKVV